MTTAMVYLSLMAYQSSSSEMFMFLRVVQYLRNLVKHPTDPFNIILFGAGAFFLFVLFNRSRARGERKRKKRDRYRGGEEE